MGSVFYLDVVAWINFILLLVTLVVEIAAFVHCLTRKSDGFRVVGSIPKGGWIAMTGGAVLVTLLFGATISPNGNTFGALLGMAASIIALVYLLDVRPALRDAIDGRGRW